MWYFAGVWASASPSFSVSSTGIRHEIHLGNPSDGGSDDE